MEYVDGQVKVGYLDCLAGQIVNIEDQIEKHKQAIEQLEEQEDE